jgi:hypothetical protein
MRLDAETQYQRLLRSYRELVTIGTDMGTSSLEMGGTDARDATQTFFNDCQTFKNWLKKDPRLRAADVEKYISASRALSLVINLRHALEHAAPVMRTSSRKARSRSQPYRIIVEWTIDIPGTRPIRMTRAEERLNFYRGTSLVGCIICAPPERLANNDRMTIARDGPLTRSTGRTITSSRLILLMDGKEYNAVQVAADCIAEWQTFLASNAIVFAAS